MCIKSCVAYHYLSFSPISSVFLVHNHNVQASIFRYWPELFYIYSLQKTSVEKLRQLSFYFQLILKLKSNPSKFIKKTRLITICFKTSSYPEIRNDIFINTKHLTPDYGIIAMRLHRKGDAITSKRQTVYDEIEKPFKRNGPMIFQKCFIFCEKSVLAAQNNHVFIQKHALSNKTVYIHFSPFHRC